MHIVSIIVVFIFYILYCLWGMGFQPHYFPWFFEFPLLVMVLFSPVPFLVPGGLWKDFVNALRIILKKKEAGSRMELQRAKEAVKLAKKTVLVTAVFLAFVHAVLALYSFDVLGSLGYLIKPIALVPIYGMAVVLILQPVQTALELKILEWEEAERTVETEKTEKTEKTAETAETES